MSNAYYLGGKQLLFKYILLHVTQQNFHDMYMLLKDVKSPNETRCSGWEIHFITPMSLSSEINCRTYSSLGIENLQAASMVSLILSWEEATKHKKIYLDHAKEGQRNEKRFSIVNYLFIYFFYKKLHF